MSSRNSGIQSLYLVLQYSENRKLDNHRNLQPERRLITILHFVWNVAENPFGLQLKWPDIENTWVKIHWSIKCKQPMEMDGNLAKPPIFFKFALERNRARRSPLPVMTSKEIVTEWLILAETHYTSVAMAAEYVVSSNCILVSQARYNCAEVRRNVLHFGENSFVQEWSQFFNTLGVLMARMTRYFVYETATESRKIENYDFVELPMMECHFSLPPHAEYDWTLPAQT